MQVTCPACSTRYTTDDAKVRGNTVRMRCRACETVWLVSGPSPEPISPPAPTENRAAVVRRGAEREHRDLFAPRPHEEGGVRQTLRPPPAGCVGARNEDSVLFTLDSLRGAAAAAKAAARTSPVPTPARDDEGLIDLAGLSARPTMSFTPLGVPVSGSEPPIGFARDAGASSAGPALSAPRRGVTPVMLAAGGALAALAIGVAAAAALFAADVPRVASTHASAVAPRAAAIATHAHELEVAARTETATRAEEEATAEKAPSPRGATKAPARQVKQGRGRTWTGGGARAASPGRATRPAAKSSGDACGCKGDFNCILRCSAKGK